MNRTDRKNGAAAAQEIARMRRREKTCFWIALLIVGPTILALYLRNGWETFVWGFVALGSAVPLFFMIFLRPKCPFCGVALTRNGKYETGTLFLPKCIKCGVPFDTPLEK
jgi:hypothetical protein